MKYVLGAVAGVLLAVAGVAYAATSLTVDTWSCEIRKNADHTGGGWNQHDMITPPQVLADGDMVINRLYNSFDLETNGDYKSVRCTMDE